jgi:hypothetical protein
VAFIAVKLTFEEEMSGLNTRCTARSSVQPS